MKLYLSKEIIKWWENRRIRFNIYSVLTGLVCLIILYILSIYLNHPIYFFFMIPSIIVYLLFLNIMYLVGWFLFEIVAISLKHKGSIDKLRNKFFVSMIGIAVLMNVGAIFLYLIEFKIL
jgi:hypothetical protein